jgi:hypothetical protein
MAPPSSWHWQSTVVNHGQRLCRELGRDARHNMSLCRRPNGRAVGTVDGNPDVTVLIPSPRVPSLPRAGPRQRLVSAEGPDLPTDSRTLGKGDNTVIIVVLSAVLCKASMCRGNNPRQRLEHSGKA